MPSNIELIEQAAVLAAELEIEVVTEGLKNGELAALVSDLRAKKQDASRDTVADGEPTEPLTAQVIDESDSYVVAHGRAVTSKRGILGEGSDVFEEYFPGGKETFDVLVANGTLVKKG